MVHACMVIDWLIILFSAEIISNCYNIAIECQRLNLTSLCCGKVPV